MTNRLFPKTGATFIFEFPLDRVRAAFDGSIDNVRASTAVYDKDDNKVCTFDSQELHEPAQQVVFTCLPIDTLQWIVGSKLRMDLRFDRGTPDTVFLTETFILEVERGYTKDDDTTPTNSGIFNSDYNNDYQKSERG